MDRPTVSNMISRTGSGHWAIAGAAGVVAFLILILAAGWGFLASIFVAGVLVAVLFLVFGLVRDPAPRASVQPTTAVARDRDVPLAEPMPAKTKTERPVEAPAATPVPPAAAPEASTALAAGSGGSGGGAAAATSPAATGTPLGEGPASGAERIEADLAARAAEPVADTVAEPEVAEPVAAEPRVEDPVGEPPAAEHRPTALDAPRAGGADDLKRIRGIGPKLERTCNELGFWHFDQIAAWTEAEVAWVDENLRGFRGRVSRDAWVAQARALAGEPAPSPAATGTPQGEGPATGAERTEADLAARAAAPVADPVGTTAPVADPVATASPVADPVATTSPVAEHRPVALDAPRAGGADDLKRIRGIGPKLERTCNDLGFWHFDQIAAWTEAEVAWVDDNLPGFRGRVSRDAWVAQARDLTGGTEPSPADRPGGER